MKKYLVLMSLISLALVYIGCPASDDSATKVQVASSTLKFSIPEIGLFPEGITYDPVTRSFFLSSLKQLQVLQIFEDGGYADFVPSGFEGLMATTGMKVDAERRILWVCTGKISALDDMEELPDQTGIFKFNIDDNTFIRKWMIDKSHESELFNDLALAENGDVYVTTFATGKVYKISSETDEMELFFQMDEGIWNNGIDFDDDEKYLFISGNDGIYRLSLETKEIIEIAPPKREFIGNADGLYFYKNTLVALQSYKKRGKPSVRIAQSFLNDDLTAVLYIVVLEQDNLNFVTPTTGTIVDGKLIYIATSYLPLLEDENNDGIHGEILILEVALLDE